MLRRKESDDPVEIGRQQKSMGPYRSAISETGRQSTHTQSESSDGSGLTLESGTHGQMRLCLGRTGISEPGVAAHKSR